jgi:hypothetical protein
VTTAHEKSNRKTIVKVCSKHPVFFDNKYYNENAAGYG